MAVKCLGVKLPKHSALNISRQEKPDHLEFEDTRRQAEKIAEGANEQGDAAFRRDIDTLESELQTELDQTVEQLNRSSAGVFPALLTVVDADFASRINYCRWLKRAYAETLPDSTVALIDGLEDRLEQLDIARQYFKTIYSKQNLADVSKLVMVTGLIAVMVASAFIVVSGYRTAPFPYWQHVLLVPLVVAVTLAPLALLISHVLRIAMVARRTAAITSFIAPPE